MITTTEYEHSSREQGKVADVKERRGNGLLVYVYGVYVVVAHRIVSSFSQDIDLAWANLV